MTDEEFLKLAREHSGFPDCYPLSDIKVFPFYPNECLTLCREIERRTLERAEKKFEWLESNLFNKQWNGVLGSGSKVYWSIHSGHRHITKEMTGDTLSEAVDRAIIKEKE